MSLPASSCPDKSPTHRPDSHAKAVRSFDSNRVSDAKCPCHVGDARCITIASTSLSRLRQDDEQHSFGRAPLPRGRPAGPEALLAKCAKPAAAARGRDASMLRPHRDSPGV
eukprot:gnl/TRDRNA2_/TRDRNA2_145856_c0_seq1.p1 gnl/TRDRNA2_/TRDRNA2_145856_c0~~gnl/TRDRNA2_/TRDRNA2_145856_c0_seq1.p1  ORF type:complete len:111 (-),score=5.71 gnl/TRDRNA2_/TRDRNA2_145856_c0_seq1:38-370(-)